MARNTDELTQYNNTIAANILAARLAIGLTGSECAKALGVSYQQYYKYESGADRVAACRLIKLSQILDVDFEQFFNGLDATPIKIRGKKDKKIQSLVAKLIDLIS